MYGVCGVPPMNGLAFVEPAWVSVLPAPVTEPLEIAALVPSK